MTVPAPRPAICPACGHPPTPPRADNPLRRLLHLPAAAPGCGWEEIQREVRVAGCSCRNRWHGG